MWIHISSCDLLIPEIPHTEEYFKNILDNLVYAHRAFDNVMYEIMKEDGEKNK